MRFIILETTESSAIEKLYKSSNNSVVRERCMFLKLSMQRKPMQEISRIMQVGRLRISRFFNAWDKASTLEEKLKTLQIKKGRGAKLKLEKVKEILPDLVRENSRNLNVVVSILAENHQIKVCKLTLQAFLKETKI